MSVYWIDHDGTRQYWFDLEPGAAITQSPGGCVTIFFGPAHLTLHDR